MRFLHIFLLFTFTNFCWAQAPKVAFECSSYVDSGFKNHDEAFAFIDKIKNAKTVDDFAKLVTYPLRVNSGKTKETLKHVIVINETAFREKFSTIFTPKLLESLHNLEPGGMLCNAQGIAIAHGLVWIGPKQGRVGIFTINQM